MYDPGNNRTFSIVFIQQAKYQEVQNVPTCSRYLNFDWKWWTSFGKGTAMRFEKKKKIGAYAVYV